MTILDDLKIKKATVKYHIKEDGDDRYFCFECKNLVDDYCIEQKFRPVDDIVRRCEDFDPL